jgi:hypothetical protein
MRDVSIQLIQLHDLGGGGNRPHGQSVADGRDPVDDCLRADADEAGRAPEVGAIHNHLEGENASGLRVAFFARLEGMVVLAVLTLYTLSAASIFAGFGLAGGGSAGGTRAHTIDIPKSCAKLDTPPAAGSRRLHLKLTQVTT